MTQYIANYNYNYGYNYDIHSYICIYYYIYMLVLYASKTSSLHTLVLSTLVLVH